MTVKALIPVRMMNLVAPLAQKATDMHTSETPSPLARSSGAAITLIGNSLLGDSVDSAMHTPPMRGIATSTTATRTTTTRASRAQLSLSADPYLFQKLVQAYIDCRRTKRNSASALAFEAHAEQNLIQLHDALVSGAYTPGRSICFVITRPKPREVWASEFQDRIVHHLLYNEIAPHFHARFTADSCACIPGRGTLYAAKRLEQQVRSQTENWSKPSYYLKCDLANFFVSIDKSVLMSQLSKQIKNTAWLSLAETILMHDPRQDVELRGNPKKLLLVPPHKSLFNAPDGHGLPIGNLSSQFFANVLLNDLDQFVKHQISAPHYIRYVDDFVLLHHCPQWLNKARERIEGKLDTLHLMLNPKKTILQPIERGIDFTGHLIKPWRRITRRRTFIGAKNRLSDMPDADVHQSANSYFGLLRQTTHSHHDRADLANLLRKRGYSIKSDLTKIYSKRES